MNNIVMRARDGPNLFTLKTFWLERAFSLIEFAIVLTVFILIFGVMAPAMMTMADNAKSDAAEFEIQDISDGIDDYFEDNGEYPDSLEDVFSPVPSDPWGNPYEYERIDGAVPVPVGQLRKDKNLVPINSDYDLYSMGPDGKSASPLTAAISHDDIVRGRDGNFFGYATDY